MEVSWGGQLNTFSSPVVTILARAHETPYEAVHDAHTDDPPAKYMYLKVAKTGSRSMIR